MYRLISDTLLMFPIIFKGSVSTADHILLRWEVAVNTVRNNFEEVKIMIHTNIKYTYIKDFINFTHL